MIKLMKQEHKGAVAFEYIIILVIMAVAIFAAWGVLSKALMNAVTKVSEMIEGKIGKATPVSFKMFNILQ